MPDTFCRMCQLTCGPEGGASMLALQGLRQLADLDLFEVSGPTAEALDEAIRLREPMLQFLQQDMFESATLQDCVGGMAAALAL